MIKDELVQLIEKALNEAQNRSLIPSIAMPDIVLEQPQNPEHGDYASALPLKLARAARMDPLTIGKHIVDLLECPPGCQSIELAPPGFINFSLKSDWLAEQLAVILGEGETFGNVGLGGGKKVQIEFVSVNPTGPLHVGHGRGAVFGSALANILSAAGYKVKREYYVNDAGNQIDAFRRSLYARYCQELGKDVPMPEEGYFGDYMIDIAGEIIAKEGDSLVDNPEDLGRLGMSRVVESIKSELKRLGVAFDVWFSERDLFEKGQYSVAMSLLKEKGFTVEKEGAVWFASTSLGEDKDNVLVRSDGSPTYFASDVAYHYNKFIERKFDRVIDIWGADHQGHVSRMKVAVGALGIDPERLEVIISQMVTLRRGEEVIRASKRTGDMITLRELMDEVGVDACRFVFLSRSADSQMEFDLELAKKQSADNPVYYVQYAHARICSILRLAEERGIDYSKGDISLLTSDPELALIRKMLQLPEVIELIANTLEPQHLPYYAMDLATVFHNFYEKCRVVTDDEALTKARLQLVKATRIVLARALGLMEMTAPEKM
ncbi:MAG: arginine--tRNA ligase [Chloroflexota bacterium]|nr:arginine--tRNA ligase [Chloroflexota bacterium]